MTFFFSLLSILQLAALFSHMQFVIFLKTLFLFEIVGQDPGPERGDAFGGLRTVPRKERGADTAGANLIIRLKDIALPQSKQNKCFSIFKYSRSLWRHLRATRGQSWAQ